MINQLKYMINKSGYQFGPHWAPRSPMGTTIPTNKILVFICVIQNFITLNFSLLVQLGQLPKLCSSCSGMVFSSRLQRKHDRHVSRGVKVCTLTVELSVVHAIGESRYFNYVYPITYSVLHETLRYNRRVQKFFFINHDTSIWIHDTLLWISFWSPLGTMVPIGAQILIHDKSIGIHA